MKKMFLLMVVVTLCLLCTACKCEHQYEENVTKEASCTAVGIKTFTCKECNESYTEEIPMVEHTYTSAVTKEPTCVEKGVKTFTCSACQDNYTSEIDLIDHNFGETKVIKESTCTTEGEKAATCTLCGALSSIEKIPTIEHAYSAKTQKQNSCTEDGKVIHTCSICGEIKEEITYATGHNWKAASCDTPKTCTNCWSEDGSSLGHNYSSGTCTRCGRKSYSFSVDPLPATRSMIVSSTQTTTDQVSITECTYNVSESGTLTVTVGYTKTFSRTDDKTYPAIGFSVAVLNSNRGIVSVKGVYERYVYVGQYKTSTITFTGLEPGTYIIAFSNYFI